jgi:hypothetical protein
MASNKRRGKLLFINNAKTGGPIWHKFIQQPSLCLAVTATPYLGDVFMQK